MLGNRLSPSKALIVGALLITTGLAGCVSSGGGSSDLLYSSFSEAKGAPAAGPYAPNMTASQLSSLSEDEARQIKIKLLTPATTGGLSEGEQDVVVLLYDASTGEPITDATMAMNARMPAMGHGTSPEEDPTHQNDGQYQGMTTWSMKGTWLLNLNAQLPSGDVLAYDLHMDIGESHGHADDGHGHEH